MIILVIFTLGWTTLYEISTIALETEEQAEHGN